MASEYIIEIEASAAKSLHRIRRNDQIRIAKAIAALATDPTPAGCVKLSGTASSYRVRIGDYRVVYSVDDTIAVVARIGHRKDI